MTSSKMGRKADRKQAPPRPLPGSDLDPRRKNNGKGKRKAPSTPDARGKFKAAKGVAARSSKDRQKRVQVQGGRRKKVDEVEEDDSDLEDALRQGYVHFMIGI